MNEGLGIPIPDTLRGWAAGKAVGFDRRPRNVLERKTNRPYEVLSRIDRLQKVARRKLVNFYTAEGQSGKATKDNIAGWSKIRQYKAPGTGFHYADDPIAKNTILVKREFISDRESETHTNTYYYWISDRNEPRTGLPFVYVGSVDKNGLRVSLFKHDTDFPEKARKMASEMFSCVPYVSQLGERSVRFEIDVWKEGKSITEQQIAKPKPETGQTRLNPIPVPEPVPV